MISICLFKEWKKGYASLLLDLERHFTTLMEKYCLYHNWFKKKVMFLTGVTPVRTSIKTSITFV